MLRAFVHYITKPPPIPSAYIEGFLYCACALFGFLAAALGSDEAAKYVEAESLFWLRTICGSASATFLSVKMFRSSSFADYKKQKQAEATEAKP